MKPVCLVIGAGIRGLNFLLSLSTRAARSWPLPLPPGAWRLAPYSIGTLAAFWTIQKVVDSVSSGA